MTKRRSSRVRVPSMNEHGRIYRHGGSVFVEAQGPKYLADIPGVVCLNGNEPEDKRVYQKAFTKKRIYLPEEYDRAVHECLTGTDVLVLGMNGYSMLSDEQCRAWGVKPGAYEAACQAILVSTTQHLLQQFPGIDIRYVHGASDLGVDKVSVSVGRMLNRTQLGHSCPLFMFWVQDDDIPVYVARTQAEYADAFITSLHVLIACNGRVQAFEHDIDAAFKQLKHVIPVNVLKSISSTGGPPAIGPDGKIEDAVAAFEQRVHLVTQRTCVGEPNAFGRLLDHIHQVTLDIGLHHLTPARAFGRFASTHR